MKVGDLVRVKNIHEYTPAWLDKDPEPGYLMIILVVGEDGYFTMILQGPYSGVTNWLGAREEELEIVSESTCKEEC